MVAISVMVVLVRGVGIIGVDGCFVVSLLVFVGGVGVDSFRAVHPRRTGLDATWTLSVGAACAIAARGRMIRSKRYLLSQCVLRVCCVRFHVFFACVRVCVCARLSA